MTLPFLPCPIRPSWRRGWRTRGEAMATRQKPPKKYRKTLMQSRTVHNHTVTCKKKVITSMKYKSSDKKDKET